jgi:hypothetical protein
MKRAVLIWAASALLIAHATRARCAPLAAAADAPSSVPCSAGVYRQFDFWVGDWDVFDVDRPTVVIARARGELILHGCVLHEVYEAMDGHKGESFSIYDATRDVWHQSWVTDHGQLLTIEGRLHGESMILQGVDQLPDGKARQVRGDWRPEDHGVREVAARSTDGGATWIPWFDLRFQPHKLGCGFRRVGSRCRSRLCAISARSSPRGPAWRDNRDNDPNYA